MSLPPTEERKTHDQRAPARDAPPNPETASVTSRADGSSAGLPEAATGVAPSAQGEMGQARPADGGGSAPGVDAVLGSLSELSQSLDAKLPALVEQAVAVAIAEFSQLMRARLTRDEQFAAMQREVEAHRSDMALKALRPLVMSVITAHDNLSKVADRVGKGTGPVERVELLKILGGVSEDLELALSQNGIDVFSHDNIGQPFDGKMQTAVGYVDTDDPVQQGKVAELIRAGFTSDSIIVQKQRVRVYRARAPS